MQTSLQKFKSVKHRVIGSLFRRQQLNKDRGAQICTPPIWIRLNQLCTFMRQQLCTVVVWVLSSVIIIARSDNSNTEIGWLKKSSLQLLFFEQGTISVSILFLVLFWRLFSKELVCLFCKSLLPFLTFVNCEGSYLAERLLSNLCPWFGIVLVPLRVITRTNNKIAEIVAASECYLKAL